jgi:hypothetical protein
MGSSLAASDQVAAAAPSQTTSAAERRARRLLEGKRSDRIAWIQTLTILTMRFNALKSAAVRA